MRRRSRTSRVLRWVAVLACTSTLALLCPRKWWDYSTTYSLTDGSTVARRTHVTRFGFPFACAERRRHTWSAKQGESPVEVNDERVRAFAAQHAQYLSRRFRCGVGRHLLGARSVRHEEQLLRSNPRASVLVIGWGVLAANTAVLVLLAGVCFYLRNRRQLGIARPRRTAGLCVKCGYNLTGNVSGVCPECGEPTPDRSSSDTD